MGDDDVWGGDRSAIAMWTAATPTGQKVCHRNVSIFYRWSMHMTTLGAPRWRSAKSARECGGMNTRSGGGMKRARPPTPNKRRAKAARADSGDGCGSTSMAAAGVLQNPDVLELILASLAYSDLRQRASVSSRFAGSVRRVLRSWRVLDERSCRSEGFLGTATHVAMAPAWLELRHASKNMQLVQRVLSVPAGHRLEPAVLPLSDGRAQHIVPPPATHLVRPTGVIFCGHNMFVADRNGAVHKYLLSLSPSSNVPISQHLAQTPRHALGAAEGLCCVGARLYACDRENNCMVAFDRSE